MSTDNNNNADKQVAESTAAPMANKGRNASAHFNKQHIASRIRANESASQDRNDGGNKGNRNSASGRRVMEVELPLSATGSQDTATNESNPAVASIDMEWDEFRGLFNSMMSGDKEEEKIAEEKYGGVSVASKINHLVRIFAQPGESDEILWFCVEHLMMLFLHKVKDIIRVWPMPKLAKFRNDLLEAIQTEQDYEKKEHIAKLIYYVKIGTGWPELTKFINECAISNEVDREQIALHLYSELTPGFLKSTTNVPLEPMVPLILKGIPHENADIRKAALSAYDSYVSSKLTRPGPIDVSLQTLIEIASKKCESCSKDHSEAVNAIYSLIQADKMRKVDVRKVIDLCNMIFRGDLGECRSQDEKHTMVMAVTGLSEKFASTIGDHQITDMLKGSLDEVADVLNDDEKWQTPDKDMPEWAITICHWYFKKIVRALGKTRVEPHLVKSINDFIDDGNWKRRAAGLIALILVGKDHYRVRPSEVVQIAVRRIVDPHCRVRYFACELLNFLLDSLPLKRIDAKLLDDALAGLRIPLSDTVRRVAVSAYCVLSRCMSTLPEELVTSHVDSLVPALTSACKNHEELFVDCWYCIYELAADAGKEKFMPHFDLVVDSLSGRCLPEEDFDRFLNSSEQLCKLVGPTHNEPLLLALVDMVGGSGNDVPKLLITLVQAVNSKLYDDAEIIKGRIIRKIKAMNTKELMRELELTKEERKTLRRIGRLDLSAC